MNNPSRRQRSGCNAQPAWHDQRVAKQQPGGGRFGPGNAHSPERKSARAVGWWARPSPWLWLSGLIVLAAITGHVLTSAGHEPGAGARPKSPAGITKPGLPSRCVLERICLDANIRGQEIGRLNLRGTDFDRVDAAGVLFDGTALEGSSFRDANLRGATFLLADLRGAVFTGACLQGALFRHVTLAGVNFAGADVEGARIPRAKLNPSIGRPSAAAKRACLG